MPENLISSVDKVDKIRPLIPKKMTMAEVALRFILMNKKIGTIIPGMRKEKNVISNTLTSDGNGLSLELYNELRKHRWDRKPTSWSQ